MRIFSFVFLALFSLLSGCSFIQQTISTQNDAVVASKLTDPHIETFRFDDLAALKAILQEQISLYSKGAGYLKKQAELYKGSEKVPHDKRIAKIEMDINMINAQIDNLTLLFPEDWDSTKTRLNVHYLELQKKYGVAYKELL
jgi:hypothetical protein